MKLSAHLAVYRIMCYLTSDAHDKIYIIVINNKIYHLHDAISVKSRFIKWSS